MIYKQNKVDEWKIKLEDKEIIKSLSFGNILKRGIASDLKLHAILSYHLMKHEIMSSYIEFIAL